MGFFQTKDPKTGEPRLGAGVFIIICLAMIGGVVLWHARQNAQDPSFIKNQMNAEAGPKSPTNVAPVAAAAAEHKESADVNTPPGVARDLQSGRGIDLNIEEEETVKQEESDNLDTIQNTIEILRQNQEKAEREKVEAVAKAKAESDAKIAELKNKALVTATTDENSKAGTPVEEDQGTLNLQSLIIYDSAGQEAKVKAAADQAKAKADADRTGFDTKNFLPRGFFFPVYLLTTVQTVNQEDIVVLGVAENVIFQHKVQLPFGTRLLGSAGASNFEDRVMINIDTILYPDGRELPISAFAKDSSDLASGIRGYYIPQPLRVQLAPYANEFIAAWTQAAADRFSERAKNNTDGNSDPVTEQYDIASNLIREQARKLQTKLDRRYPEKVVVPIGTKAYVQLRAPLDLTAARIAGSLDNRQPILPGYENNPVSAGGVVERTANYGISANRTVSGQLTNQPTAPYTNNEAMMAAQQAAQQAEIQNYLSNITQLQELEKQNSTRAKTGNKAPASAKVNWPKGDIE